MEVRFQEDYYQSYLSIPTQYDRDNWPEEIFHITEDEWRLYNHARELQEQVDSWLHRKIQLHKNIIKLNKANALKK